MRNKNNNIKQNLTFGLMFPIENKNEFQEDTKGQTANIDINSFFYCQRICYDIFFCPCTVFLD